MDKENKTRVLTAAQSLPPLRGIIPAANMAGCAYDLTTLRKWIRLNRSVFKVDKIDLIIHDQIPEIWNQLLEFANTEKILLSPRISDAIDPALAADIFKQNVHDVCLCFVDGDIAYLKKWVRLAAAQNIPVRARINASSATLNEIDLLTEVLADACAVVMEISDPFLEHGHGSSGVPGALLVERINALARALTAANKDAAIVGLPFCLVDEDNLPVAMNTAQFFADHLQYHKDSYLFAKRICRFKSGRVSTAIENQLARKTSLHNLIDAALFPWIIDYPRFYIRVWMYHKLTRRLPFFQPGPRPLPENLTAYENELRKYRRKKEKRLGHICSACRFQLVCDGLTKDVKKRFPDVKISAQSGETVLAAPCETQSRERYYDKLDMQRREMPQRVCELAKKARHLLTHTSPTREISADTYDIAQRFTHHMPGAVRWLSFGKGCLNSTTLARLEPPFTISYTLGGGIAGHAGFYFGRHAKILCPLIDYSHRITLSVAEDGCYVLLRDGEIVRPTEFEDGMHLPAKLDGVLEPRLSLRNIDGMILTQTVLLWKDGEAARHRREKVKYSVIIISTRYTRRLQAALLALAHQRDVPAHLYEIIIGYVPGIDATDDLIDSIESSFADLRIVRAPFDEGRVRAKGFMINEALREASGKWVLLMDADIILPPNTFALLESVEENRHFIAPDGRKMLPPDVTGKILLNELRPWESFEAIMAGPGEVRRREADNTPIGFFQCVRREILERIPYHELDHFEASDWHFGRDVAVNYGREYRLQDFYVLHLDHGGSQWYGTHKHR